MFLVYSFVAAIPAVIFYWPFVAGSMRLQSSLVGKFLLFAVILSVAPALADSAAHDKDSDKIIEAAIIRLEYDPYSINLRGGASTSTDKPLGVYRNGKSGTFETKFENQEYVRLDPVLKAHWALSLHKFIVQEGGGSDNTWIATLAPRPNQPHQDPLDVTYVPYQVVESYAEDFFKNNAREKLGKLTPSSKDSFVNEAILDGVNLYGAYEKYGLKVANDDGLWITYTLDRYKRKIGDGRPKKTQVPNWLPAVGFGRPRRLDKT